MGVDNGWDASQFEQLPPMQVAPMDGYVSVPISAGLRAMSRFQIRVDQWPAYACTLHVRVGKHGVPECFYFSLDVFENERPKIDWKLLRAVPLDTWLKHGLTLVTSIQDESGLWITPGLMHPSPTRDMLLERVERAAADGPGSRRPLTKGFLTAVAAIYSQAEATTGKPIVALEAAFPDHKRSTINAWVRRARKDGLIAPATYTRRKTKGDENV